MTKKSTAVVVLDAPELQGIEESKALAIKAIFEPMTEMLATFEGAYTKITNEAKTKITSDVTAKAKRLRLDIGKIRIAGEKARKDQKEEYLRAGKAIDGVNNILKWAITDKENNLKEIEDHFDIIEKQRLADLQTKRVELLSPYVEEAHERDLAGMAGDVWDTYYQAKKNDHEILEKAKADAETKRIADEKADAEEAARIRQENEQLKVAAAEKVRLDNIAQEKRDKAEADRVAKEKADREERELVARADQAARAEKARKERESHEAALKAERDEKERLDNELKAKAQAEDEAKAAAAEKIQVELTKDDIAKKADLMADLVVLKSKYTFKSKKNQDMYSGIGDLIDKIVTHMEAV